MRKLIVTGASRGLGAHISRRAIQSGYSVLGIARTPVDMGEYEVVECDVSDRVAVDAIFKPLRNDTSVWGLINVAGIASMNLVMATPDDTIQNILDTNLKGTINCSAAVAKILCRRKEGRIINFSTIAVSLALKGEAIYAASKSGVETFTRTFAREIGDHGVTANVIAPGPIATDLIRNIPEDDVRKIVDRQIIQKQAVPDDVWNIISLLLEPRADMITGEVIHVGGV